MGGLQQVEPEHAQAGEDAALVGDAGRQDPVEGADAVGGDQQEPFAQIVNVAHLAAPAGNPGNLALQ